VRLLSELAMGKTSRSLRPHGSLMHMNRAIIPLSVLLVLATTVSLAFEVQAVDPSDTGVTPRMGPTGPTHGARDDLQPSIDPARVTGLVAVVMVALGAALALRRRQPAHE
jgi:hypothetical protein